MLTMDAKLQTLRDTLIKLQPGIIGASGGVDSSFLAWFAGYWGLDYLAVFLEGPHLSPDEARAARNLLPGLPLSSAVASFSPLDVLEVRENPRDRCYHCKTALLARLRTLGRTGRETVVDGSHLSDRTEYRPGRRALREQGAVSPLAEAGILKEEIRAYARDMGLEQAEQPSRPCLMTRFAYGQMVTNRMLAQVGRAEDALRAMGLSHFRIRIVDQGRCLLHIHSSQRDAAFFQPESIHTIMEQAGFSSFGLECVDTLSGYFDRTSPGVI
ncbi:hypothetical protein [Desulfovermiculus halophilus]|uniref:hypothetical protein n=1 Tax=Desulfovermiculus halophilus TaxID=339722 RepID=UPI0006845C92|nr:hypothetical protein [Desulfovermiculus halophilus]